MAWTDLLTAPLSGLYATAVWLRHLLYDEHVLPSYTVDIPTICVGNLAVGGTGKTPHIEALIRMLAPHYRVAVLSRGYRRRTRGFVLADEHATARTIGDEAMLLYMKYPDVRIAVCEDRVRGVRQLRKQCPELDVILLDDSFQHRRLKAGYNIILTAYDRLYKDDHMLPWGRLRDLKQRVLKANAIIVTNCPDDLQPIDRRVVDNHLRLPAYMQLYFSRIRYQEVGMQGRPLVLAGIANPQYLMQYVSRHYAGAELMAFPTIIDSHPPTPSVSYPVLRPSTLCSPRRKTLCACRANRTTTASPADSRLSLSRWIWAMTLPHSKNK